MTRCDWDRHMPAETSLHDVARMMITYQIHSVLVQEAQPGSRPFGIVSALDIAASAGGSGRAGCDRRRDDRCCRGVFE